MVKYDNITRETFNSLDEKERKHIEDYRHHMFTLSPVELLRYKQFVKDHKKCREGLTSTIGGFGPIVSFVGTGLGNIVHCKCRQCGEEADITDIDSW